MANLRVSVATPATASGVATKTISQIVAAANHRVKVERVRVSGDDDANGSGTPPLCQLCLQDDAGASSATGEIYKMMGSDDETIQTTARDTFTTEPTTTTDIKAQQFVPTGGYYDFVFPDGRELWIEGGTRLGCRLVSPVQDHNYSVQWDLEE